MSNINIDGKNLNEITEINFQTVGPYEEMVNVLIPAEEEKIISISGSIQAPSEQINVDIPNSTNSNLLASVQQLWDNVTIDITNDEGTITSVGTNIVTLVPPANPNTIIIGSTITSQRLADLENFDSISISGTGILKYINEGQYELIIDYMETTNVGVWQDDFFDFFVQGSIVNGNGNQNFGILIPQYNSGISLVSNQSNLIIGLNDDKIVHTADSLINTSLNFGGDYGMGEEEPEITITINGYGNDFSNYSVAAIRATYNSNLTEKNLELYSQNNNVKVDLLTGNPFETQNLKIWQGEEENPSIEIQNLTPIFSDNTKFIVEEDLSNDFPFPIFQLSNGRFQTTVEYPNGMPDFPEDEYNGIPSLYETFTDSAGNAWQWQWLTNGQFYGGGANADNLTSPPQYAWLLASANDEVERTYIGWFTPYFDSNNGSEYYEWYGTSINGENMPNKQYYIEVPGINTNIEVFQGIVSNWGEGNPGTTLDKWFSFEIPTEEQYNNVRLPSVRSDISYRLAPPLGDEYIVDWKQTVTSTFTPQISELPINFVSSDMISSSFASGDVFLFQSWQSTKNTFHQI